MTDVTSEKVAHAAFRVGVLDDRRAPVRVHLIGIAEAVKALPPGCSTSSGKCRGRGSRGCEIGWPRYFDTSHVFLAPRSLRTLPELEALAGVAGVESAFVFGSWAARYAGEAGPPPRDVDVLVVADADLRAVRRVCRPVEEELRVEISPVTVEAAEWANADPSPFIAQIKSQPLVAIPVDRA